MDNKLILITGANGFVGTALCSELLRRGAGIRAVVRQLPPFTKLESPQGIETTSVGPISADTDWKLALYGVRFVVHLAARTHILHEDAGDSLAKYRQINVEATARLARMAAAAGVNRFIFLSSVKVNGERTLDHPFADHSTPRPEDAYGISKWEAEQALARIAKETGMEVVVLRSPLVYGPGVKGNFLRLMGWVARGTPLPFASLANRRSLIYVGNLVAAVTACIEARAAAGKTYLVSDGEDVSTPDLIRAVAAALGVRPRLFPVPPTVLRLGAVTLGQGAEMRRLLDSLQVDGSRIRDELGWRPPYTLAEGLSQAAQWYGNMIDRERACDLSKG
jgi:nucleoside-diphosphate-sugar epimerase